MKDTQGNPITEEEFMKDIGHGVGIKDWKKDWYLAEKFHNLYEKYAPEFGYETREDTKLFDPKSKNGQLMTKVCNEILKEERYKGYEEGRDDGFKEAKNAVLSEVSRWIAEGCAETDTMVGLAKFLRSKLVKRHE